MIKTLKVVAILTSILIARACSGGDGQATFDYLKAQQRIVEKGQRNLKAHQFPKPPPAPEITKQTKPKERLALKKEHREALAQYCTNVIQITMDYEKILNKVQNQLSGLNSAGVEPEAITLVTFQEQVLGDGFQLLIKFRALATRAQEDIRKPQGREAMFPHFALGIIELMEGSPLGGIAQMKIGISEQERANNERVQEDDAKQLHLDDSTAALEDAKTTFASDRAKPVTQRSQLITILAARYPDYTWKSLWTPPSEKPQ